MLAVLFTYVPSTGENFATPIEGPGCVTKAHALKESCKDDFPGAIWSVAADDEATKDVADERMRALFGDDWKAKTDG